MSKTRLLTICLIFTVVMGACRSSRTVSKPSVPAQKDKNRTEWINPKLKKELKADELMLVEEAITWLGTPYRFGGQDYSGTDCSGLTMKVYDKALGIKIPRNSAEQQKFCSGISQNALKAGDLIFFCTGRDRNRVSHVGIYIGDGKFIHSSSSRGVIVSALGENYYVTHYHSSGFVPRKGRSNTKTAVAPVKATIKEQPKAKELPAPIPQSVTLDDVIETRIDSIYNSFFD